MLNYIEDRYRNTLNLTDGLLHQPIQFKSICPSVSDTIEKQQMMNKEKRGLTIVACFNNDLKAYIKEQIIDVLQSTNYHFFSYENNLHCTFLTLLDVGKSFSDPTLVYTISKYVKKFFRKNKLLGRIYFTLNFDCIRPGTPKKLEHQNQSDGTVIIYGKYQTNTDFVECAESLAKDLKSHFSNIFPENYNRIAPTVWCTLGYFQKDFELREETEIMFNQWKNLNEFDLKISTIQIKELKMLKTPTKSLANSEHLLTI